MPHPLLCGRTGVINVLPDHMHEGHCIVPADMTKTFTFDGYSASEYPNTPGGWQPIPMIVAWGSNLAGHTTRVELKDAFGGMLGQTNEILPQLGVSVLPATFGLICAYNGHPADIGRVVVGSTFHHYININLTGAGANNPQKQGFGVSTDGQAALAKIKNYYENLAVWLAPLAVQQAMLDTALWLSRWDNQLSELSGREWMLENINSQGLGYFGMTVTEVLGRLASRCMSRGWILSAIDPWALLLPNEVYVDLHRPDPPPWRRRAV